MTINDLAATVLRVTDSRSELLHRPGREGDVRHSMAEISRLRAAGFKPSVDFDEALAETVRWFAGNRG